MVLIYFNKQNKYTEIIIIIYIKTLEVGGKFAIIQNYIKTVETCKFAQTISEFGYTRNYIPNNSDKTIWCHQKLQLSCELAGTGYVIIINLSIDGQYQLFLHFYTISLHYFYDYPYTLYYEKEKCAYIILTYQYLYLIHVYMTIAYKYLY